MYWNISHVLSLAKGYPQLLQTNLLKRWQNTDRYDQNICVAGFDHEHFAAFFCCVMGMHKDLGVGFLMATRRHLSQVYGVVAESILFFGNNDHIRCRHLCNLVSQKVEQLSFVVIASEEVPPV